jgi:hypothetical protein
MLRDMLEFGPLKTPLPEMSPLTAPIASSPVTTAVAVKFGATMALTKAAGTSIGVGLGVGAAVGVDAAVGVALGATEVVEPPHAAAMSEMATATMGIESERRASRQANMGSSPEIGVIVNPSPNHRRFEPASARIRT